MRKLFPLLLFLFCFCVPVFPLDANAQFSPQPREEIRGAWIHNYGPFDWETAMKELAGAGFNTVFVRVARGANAIYPSKYLPRDDWADGTSEDEFRKALNAAHRNGLEFHAWKVCFFVGGAALQKGASKKFYDQLANDDRLARDPQGKQAPFLSPADPRNQELELQVLREMTEKYEIDGIHLDYIRYPENPHYDFDYGAVSRREFEAHLGRAVTNWPEDVFSGSLKWEYENWERSNIDNLVRRAYEQSKKLRPHMPVSAAVWRTNRTNRAAIKQDWIKWAQNGWLDFVAPMNYTRDDLVFRNDLKSQIPHAAGRLLYAAGIGNYLHKDAESTLRQIQIAREEGADGYILFDYQPKKYERLLEQLKVAQLKSQKSNSQQKTVPSPVRTPKIGWTVSVGTERKDQPAAYPVGSTLSVKARSKSISGLSAELQSLDGAISQKIGAPNTQKESEFGWSFPVPAGRWRFAVSGIDGNIGKEFTARGPLFDGLLPAAMMTLQAQEQPPVVTGSGRKIAVYSGGLAESGLMRALQTVPMANAYQFHRLEKPEHWRGAEVLLLPQLRDVQELSPQVVENLREWVSEGGTILLTHDAVGFRWHARIFPEIGQGTARSTVREVNLLKNSFGFASGAWQHEYPDHIAIAPGPDGQVIAQNKDGKAVLVGGRFGKGKVFLYGALLGYAPGGKMGEGETRLLHDLVKTNAQ